ncbi:MAG: DUF5020 family protein [Flavobacterium sp.]|nr:MAG: DUF5020 family protein [Flavobacterium sp.]
MRHLLHIILYFWSLSLTGQNLQLHFDLQHSTVPSGTTKNHPTLYFDYFNAQDSGKHFIKPGSFLFKTQADFTGEKNNIGKFYLQISQTFRCWRPKFFAHLQYSAGAGLTEPRQYSYYIRNTFSVGVSYPFKWGNTWLTALADYRMAAYNKMSHDAMVTVYWWKGLLNYKAEFSGDFSVWTENKNQGDEASRNMHGKRLFFFAEPQLWYKVFPKLSVGSRVSVNYHVLASTNTWQVYPSVGLRCKLEN